MNDQTKISKCEKFGCRPRINDFGVSWCTECGKLFTFNLNHKPLDKNFLMMERKWWNNLSTDDQMWIMMKYGFSDNFNPNRVTQEEVIKLYNLEHDTSTRNK